MAVSLRLDRKGARHRPYFHLIAIDRRKKRSGMPLQYLGTYDPLGVDAVRLDREAIAAWLARGAEPSTPFRALWARYGGAPGANQAVAS